MKTFFGLLLIVVSALLAGGCSTYLPPGGKETRAFAKRVAEFSAAGPRLLARHAK